MKILLVGEYSRLHNSLKEGLVQLGHEVAIVATGDHFKNYEVDYSIRARFLNDYWLIRKTKNLVYRLTRLDLGRIESALRFYFLIPTLKDYTHIQLINSNALETYPQLSLWLYKKLLTKKTTLSLLVCGDETPVNDYLLKNKLRYSVFTPYLQKESLKGAFQHALSYTKPKHRQLFEWVNKRCDRLIVSDLDYKIPMVAMNYAVKFIPNPINTHKIVVEKTASQSPIVIFLGINRVSYHQKGIIFFEEALKIIKEKYGNQVTTITSENVPYEQYIDSYRQAHILLDQVYGFDQGYNALEAMAKGKVVFTGAEIEFKSHYQLTETVAINALPDTQAIVKELSFLIDNPEQLRQIGINARRFIEKEHYYIQIAKEYLAEWDSER